MNRDLQLYDQVVLAKNYPEYSLQKGDVATIVEIIKKENKSGYALEFFDSNGDTLNVIMVNENDIEVIKPHSVVNYRELQKH